MALKKKEILSAVTEISEPIAVGLGIEIWDVEYVKEGPNQILRLYIDKLGGVFIDDCEKLSRAVDPYLDELDMPDSEYNFEVSSPGLGRVLRTDKHLERFVGDDVKVRLIRPLESGEREFEGKLTSFDPESVTLDTENGSITLSRAAAAFIKLMDDRDLVGGDK